jgi:hypothetical protein
MKPVSLNMNTNVLPKGIFEALKADVSERHYLTLQGPIVAMCNTRLKLKFLRSAHTACLGVCVLLRNSDDYFSIQH